MSADAVRVLLFATLRQMAGASVVELTISGDRTVGGCWDELCAQMPQLSSQRQVVRPAVNRTYVGWDTPVCDGDELAFIPPVSGGYRE
ncbi:MAG TPA: MoaD/ThiS family protein [Candidatus Dormibacteraeota bacterium]|nr:MoaD/ThiS family protein [Candidatus Dormibacteraeota bacterium]